ncbi:MAG: formylglycine-generating enzyme family protein [Bacteroidales bacterium]|nr:formylglycine-generating enzyme family protein [Bacteroidales bacterium]
MKKNYLSNLTMVVVVLIAACTITVTSCKKKREVKNPYEVVFVEGGTYWMGSQSDSINGRNYDPLAWDNEDVHEVTVGSFYMGKYEVTQTQWIEMMGVNPSYFRGNADILPIENISFSDIEEFIKRLNEATGKTYRLPTEEEWEYAARGGQPAMADSTFYTFKYSGSNRIAEVGWFEGSITDPTVIGNGMHTTHAIGEKFANQLGIYDMTGNVREWCSNLYTEHINSIPAGPLRVQRGGCWNYLDRGCRNTSRYNGSDNADFTLGLRLVQE